MVNAAAEAAEWTKWVPQMISVAVIVVQGLVTWVLWSLRKSFVRKEDCSACSEQLAEKVQHVERELGKLPSPESWAAMQVAIEEVRGSNRVVLAKIDGQGELLRKFEHPMQLLIEHHIKGNN